ncbi:hypothetical protein J6590_012152 [Homalodisca vitripennis]|nr:hypothetical protein J6590_012152 [Homalodisca vitripennis]
MLLLLSSSPKALQNLLCPDITDVLKTIMTYVAVRILVYELILQLSINSLLGLEKSHSCGILEDVINDFKKKESYLTSVHYNQLHSLAATSHGRNYLVKYDALESVSKKCPDISRECTNHLITVVPQDLVSTHSGL